MREISSTLHHEAERVPGFKVCIGYAIGPDCPSERRRRADVLRRLAKEAEEQPWSYEPDLRLVKL